MVKQQGTANEKHGHRSGKHQNRNQVILDFCLQEHPIVRALHARCLACPGFLIALFSLFLIFPLILLSITLTHHQFTLFSICYPYLMSFTHTESQPYLCVRGGGGVQKSEMNENEKDIAPAFPIKLGGHSYSKQVLVNHLHIFSLE